MMSEKEKRANNTQGVNFKLLYTLRGHTNSIASVKFSPNGSYLASSSYDKIINIWDVSSGTLEYKLSGHKKGVSEIDWSQNGNLLVSASDDKRLKLWNVKKEKCVKTLKGHDDIVFCASFSNENFNLIASGSDDRTVKQWDVGTGECLCTISDHTDRIVSVDFNPHARTMLSASHDGYCYIYDIVSQQMVSELICAHDTESLSFAKYSPNGNFVLTATLNNKIRLWSVKQKRCVKTYEGHVNSKYCLYSCFFQGKCIVSGSEDNCIYVWNLNTLELLQKIEGHKAVVLSVDCHPSQNIIASGSLEEDMTIKVWKD